ncbi:MAG: two-component sensor histidine kinase [Cyclobacteriaceae bacterium]|nr:MAG: two-component sensor histidine kinase [Cyclobacteriaceae bacterium]
MKLILKFTLLFLLISLGVFFVGGVITYQVVKKEIDEEQERFLLERLEFFTNWIQKHSPEEAFIREKIQIYPLNAGHETDVVFSDTVVMHRTLERLEPHIKLDVIRAVNGRLYKISLFEIIVEEDDIVDSVRESMIKIYLLLTVVMLVVGSLVGVILFRPFNQTLDQIKNFRLDQNSPLEFSKTGTVEFNKLNSFVQEMTGKIQRDYRSLREFTENASHEMQTPLTNAIGKLELILSSGQLTEENNDRIIATLSTLKHLSKMGNSLNLLTKIDNREFEKIEQVNLSDKLNAAIDNFSELIELKSLDLKSEHEQNVLVAMDATLTTILINNLLSNAIRHNVEHGSIKTFLDQKSLIIKNTGPALGVDPQAMFDRFRKDQRKGDGLGLGLAIVKKICDYSGFQVQYAYENENHKLEILFRK